MRNRTLFVGNSDPHKTPSNDLAQNSGPQRTSRHQVLQLPSPMDASVQSLHARMSCPPFYNRARLNAQRSEPAKTTLYELVCFSQRCTRVAKNRADTCARSAEDLQKLGEARLQGEVENAFDVSDNFPHCKNGMAKAWAQTRAAIEYGPRPV